MRHEADMVPRPAERWQHLQLAGRAVDGDVHETVERHRNPVGHHAIGLQRRRQIAEAASVTRQVGVEMIECVDRTRRQQEVVHPDRVFNDLQHYPRTVGIELVPFGQPDRLGIIERAAGRDHLVQIIRVEGQQIGHLSPARIDHGQAVALGHAERVAAARGDFHGPAAHGLASLAPPA